MQTPPTTYDKRRMPGWVVALIVAPLALCVTCASVGYFVVRPRVFNALANSRQAVSDQIAESVYTSLSSRIATRPTGVDMLVVRPGDLDVNNAESSGDWQVHTGTDGTYLSGIETRISPGGISIHFGDSVTCTGIPQVVANRIEMTSAVMMGDVPFDLLTAEGFADGMERGINRALDDHGLVPTAIRLGNGQMTIETMPVVQDQHA
jgi:hypothetical protein